MHAYIYIYIYVYIIKNIYRYGFRNRCAVFTRYIRTCKHMSDDQNPRRGVLYKRMNGVCCCKFVVRFAWEAQESARAGARYINIVVLFCISEHLLL